MHSHRLLFVNARVLFSSQSEATRGDTPMQATERERALEEALVEYVLRYGLTNKARAVLSHPLSQTRLEQRVVHDT